MERPKLPDGAWVVENRRQVLIPVFNEQNRSLLAEADYTLNAVAEAHDLTPEYDQHMFQIASAYCKHLEIRQLIVLRRKPD